MQNLFSYPLTLDDLGSGTKSYHIKATPIQLKFIAEVLKVEKIETFEAQITLNFNHKAHRIDVKGIVNADVEQTSVISLEKFIKHYSPEFEIVFDTELTAAQLREMDFEFEDEVPDILENGQLDLAAIAMEQLALTLDDFPRKDGEIFSFVSEFDEDDAPKENPFAVLAKLKK